MQVTEANKANPDGSIIYHSGMNPKIQRNPSTPLGTLRFDRDPEPAGSSALGPRRAGATVPCRRNREGSLHWTKWYGDWGRDVALWLGRRHCGLRRGRLTERHDLDLECLAPIRRIVALLDEGRILQMGLGEGRAQFQADGHQV